jgi:hypothetical protein
MKKVEMRIKMSQLQAVAQVSLPLVAWDLNSPQIKEVPLLQYKSLIPLDWHRLPG